MTHDKTFPFVFGGVVALLPLLIALLAVLAS